MSIQSCFYFLRSCLPRSEFFIFSRKYSFPLQIHVYLCIIKRELFLLPLLLIQVIFCVSVRNSLEWNQNIVWYRINLSHMQKANETAFNVNRVRTISIALRNILILYSPFGPECINHTSEVFINLYKCFLLQWFFKVSSNNHLLASCELYCMDWILSRKINCFCFISLKCFLKEFYSKCKCWIRFRP